MACPAPPRPVCSAMEAHGASVLKRIAGTTVAKGMVKTAPPAAAPPQSPAAGEKRSGSTAGAATPTTAPAGKKHKSFNSSFATQIASQALVAQELLIDEEMGIASRDGTRLLLKEYGGRSSKARKGEKWTCVEDALERSVLTEFAALLRGEWGDDLPVF